MLTRSCVRDYFLHKQSTLTNTNTRRRTQTDTKARIKIFDGRQDVVTKLCPRLFPGYSPVGCTHERSSWGKIDSHQIQIQIQKHLQTNTNIHPPFAPTKEDFIKIDSHQRNFCHLVLPSWRVLFEEMHLRKL